VGRSIGEKIHEYLTTGSITELEGLRAQIPPGVRELMAVPGLGPKKAIVLFEELGVASVDELAAAVAEDRIAGLKGFGAKTQENIARGLEQLASSRGRVQVGVALDLAEAMLAELEGLRGVRRAAFAGSLRRMQETIGDVDLLVASEDAGPIMERFTTLPSVSRVLAHGPTKSSVITTAGIQVDLRVIPREVWGAAMIYFTGSKGHNVRIREMAVRKGLKLNEYGIFTAKEGTLLAAETEEDVYAHLGLPFIPPTLREDRGEIEAALEGTLPDVLTERQLRGDLHTHTDLTDGVASLEDMVAAAAELKYAYYAVTDHAPNLFMQRMTDEKILAQRAQIQRLQSRYPKMRLLHGTELNIDPDGGVDWDEDFLADFDVNVASVHSHFTLSKEEQTRRVIRAIEHPSVHVIGHLTGRRIGSRAPIELDLEAVFAAAGRTGTALEVNSHPDRLDLKDEHILWAKRHGVRFAVTTDAHSTVHLALRRFGVATAQRGWLTKDDVIDAWPLTKLQRFLRKGRSA
jgi:DNA polymerase (family 10)